MATPFSSLSNWNEEMSEEEHHRWMRRVREEENRKEKEHRRWMKELDEESERGK